MRTRDYVIFGAVAVGLWLVFRSQGEARTIEELRSDIERAIGRQLFDFEVRILSYKDIIFDAARQYELDPLVIAAVISIESSGNANAKTWEPKANPPQYSRGLMQILYTTAQWLDYNGAPEGLFDPLTNISLGSKYLAYQYGRYGNALDMVAAYNAGSVFRMASGYTNQSYVDNFLTAYNRLAKIFIQLPDYGNWI